MPDNTIRGRFAPSPSGRLHLGNVLTFLLAWLDVRARGGTMVFRLEDLDPERSWEHYAELMADDLLCPVFSFFRIQLIVSLFMINSRQLNSSRTSMAYLFPISDS